jgi:ribosomal RNA-processing protein 36
VRRTLSLPVQGHNPRDPRFDTLSTQEVSSAYNFLDNYQRDEIALLNAQIKETRDSEVGEQLSKTLQSLRSRRDARQGKLRAEKVLRERKQRERELVEKGKQPYYLKKSTCAFKRGLML